MRYVNGCRTLWPVAGTALVMNFKLPVENDWETGLVEFLPVSPIKIRISISRCWRPLISPAITVAMLGAVNPYSAVVSDRKVATSTIPNVELVGQGIANIFSPLFGGFPPRERLPEPPRISVRSEDAGRRYGHH